MNIVYSPTAGCIRSMRVGCICIKASKGTKKVSIINYLCVILDSLVLKYPNPSANLSKKDILDNIRECNQDLFTLGMADTDQINSYYRGARTDQSISCAGQWSISKMLFSISSKYKCKPFLWEPSIRLNFDLNILTVKFL